MEIASNYVNQRLGQTEDVDLCVLLVKSDLGIKQDEIEVLNINGKCTFKPCLLFTKRNNFYFP